ncbi:DNA adenine methylase [Mucilaginibacter jinjuensis]|uniref:Site-specific DNA-methyltransferase (adenine-specific) n=1 Tax=Mucilaginibacter jinjuensis TaxID=1176721 RepID=A0ABY7T5L5_9SPHI|nr:Dam family site-specific DNA-(adenine-N6)-methyltransferase [Mucilaginibacter jinjuensis]WCT11554.1 Dam family site-specific DNA-(adenine-N6)-methyltransferase [Mucilaginibacter jinjuensis]
MINESSVINKNSLPFLRWTGSKRWFTKNHIDKFLPPTFNSYHEPFLGGGAVFFHLQGKNNQAIRYYLSDTNEELINAYLQIRDNPSLVVAFLKNYNNNEIDYYKVRSSRPDLPAQQAARFIYLNRTSFNGIYRVNSHGEYNVPYGKRQRVDYVTEQLLLDVSDQLQGVNLIKQTFEKALFNIKANDLVFLDPPYTVAHENNGFIEYNQQLFAWEDQVKLRDFVVEIQNLGAYFLLTNASHKSIVDLYDGIGQIEKVSRISQVGGRNKTRGMYNELIITNII